MKIFLIPYKDRENQKIKQLKLENKGKITNKQYLKTLKETAEEELPKIKAGLKIVFVAVATKRSPRYFWGAVPTRPWNGDLG